MYKVLIVDDENLVRQGLKVLINWQSLGFFIAGEASDGKEALELIKKNVFDVIVTDVRMPVIGGLQLIQIIREQEIKCKIIIISGHRDFEYAKSAIKYEVTDYILKPINAHHLTDALNRISISLNHAIIEGTPEAEKTEIIPDNTMKIIQKLKMYVDEHYTSDLNIQFLSQVAGYNPIYLGRLFHSKENISLKDYIDNIRIDKSLELLKNGSYKINDVAARVGYKDINRFYKAFKKFQNCNPSKYKQFNIGV